MARKVKYPTMYGIKASRYVGIKGVLWTIFSRFTRKRDFLRYNGKCVSCNSILSDWKDGDAGHYVSVSRGNFDTLFCEKNVALQCKRCNNPSWTPDASIPFGKELDRRHGIGTADEMYRRSNAVGKEYSKPEYEEQIIHYKEAFENLEE